MFRTRDICRNAVAQLIDVGFVPPYVSSGDCPESPQFQEQLSPIQRQRIHYHELQGPLYSDVAPWQFVYEVVRSFTRDRDFETSLELPELFGVIPLSIGDLLAQLPSVFAQLGLTCIDKNEVAQTATFVSTDACEVKGLPEPYGKWLQHRAQQTVWTRLEALEVVVDLSLCPQSSGTLLNVSSSTLTLPLWLAVADKLNRVFRLTDHPLDFSLDYVRDRARFTLAGKPVPFTHLAPTRRLQGLYRGQRRELPRIEGVCEATELYAYFRFFRDGVVLHTIHSSDFLGVSVWLRPDTKRKPVGRGRFWIDGPVARFSIGEGPTRVDYQGTFENGALCIDSSHSTTKAGDRDRLIRVSET